MWVWGGLTLTHRWCRKEVSRLWLTPAPRSWREGGACSHFLPHWSKTGRRLLLLGTAPPGDCSCPLASHSALHGPQLPLLGPLLAMSSSTTLTCQSPSLPRVILRPPPRICQPQPFLTKGSTTQVLTVSKLGWAP